MTDTNIKHIDVGATLTKTEWEAAGSHEITPSIADDAIVTIDDADAADNDYAKFTSSGLEGRSYSEVRGDLGVLESIDEDDMASDLDTKVPTQQSVKAYVDAEVGEAGELCFEALESAPTKRVGRGYFNTADNKIYLSKAS